MSPGVLPHLSVGGRGDSVPQGGSVPAFLAGTSTNNNQEPRHELNLADVLLSLGLWVTRRDHREHTAQFVEALGFTAEQVEPLLRHIMAMAGTQSIGAGEIVNLLRDRDRLKAAVEDWSKVAAKNAARPALAPGEAVRRSDSERVRQFELDWADYERRKAQGLTDETPRKLPWPK